MPLSNFTCEGRRIECELLPIELPESAFVPHCINDVVSGRLPDLQARHRKDGREMIDVRHITWSIPIDTNEFGRIGCLAGAKELKRRHRPACWLKQPVDVPRKLAADRDGLGPEQQTTPQCYEASHAGAVATYILVAIGHKVLVQLGNKLEKILCILSRSVREVISAWIFQDHDVEVCTRDELQEKASWYQQPFGLTRECENNTLAGAS